MSPTFSDEPLSPEELKALRALTLKWDYKPLDAVSGAFTAGCSLSFAVVNLEEAHLTQEDVGLNKLLWALWPTSGLDDYIKTNQDKADRHFKPVSEYWPAKDEPAYDLEKLKEALLFAERARIASNVRLLNALHVRLNRTGMLPVNVLSEGINPLMLLSSRKKMLDVAPLAQAVEAASKLTAKGDGVFSTLRSKDGEETAAQLEARHRVAITALGSYCSALMGLWPWTASGLIMTRETAFDSGLAQLEAALWRKIATATIQLIKYSDSQRGLAEGTYFAVLARLCNLVPLLTRYVPLGGFWDCHGEMVLYAMPFSMMGFGYEATAGFEGMIMSAIYEGSDGWAHAQCDTEHTTCRFGGADRSDMPRRPLPEPKAKESEASTSKSQEDGAEDKAEEGAEERNYYDRQGKVVGTGPNVPMRLHGGTVSSTGPSKPSTAYPCD